VKGIYCYSYLALTIIPLLYLDTLSTLELSSVTYCVILIYRVRHRFYGRSLQSLLLFP